MALCLSSTYATVDVVHHDNVDFELADIKRNVYDFPDGIGKIPRDLAMEVTQRLQLNTISTLQPLQSSNKLIRQDLNHTLQALQTQLALLASPQSESHNKPNGEKKVVTKSVTRASTSKSKKAKEVVTKTEANKLAEEEKEELSTIKEDNILIRKKKDKAKLELEYESVQVEEKVEIVQAESVNVKTLDHELLVSLNVPNIIKDTRHEVSIKF
ncbi:hypothetical protein POM88_012889 [Heracleum sosnowskyi]|uniref:RNA-dependent RNA polymerase n=1 Tax=Heracleum sosnowskyi TaxID=360622 RepID=A0AAD8IYX2_9APIA|nr:hypothetical protein POM88_012889 [Heracleum sosnowskyi]